VVDAAATAYRDSNDLSDSARAAIQAADEAFRDAILAIPSTTSSASEATQAYTAAIDTYNTSIEAVRESQNC
jgi:phage shock protein A